MVMSDTHYFEMNRVGWDQRASAHFESKFYDVEGFLAGAFVSHKTNTPGQEVLLSLKQDPAFGPCVVLGIGGTLTEWYGRGSGGGSTLILPAFGLDAESDCQLQRR